MRQADVIDAIREMMVTASIDASPENYEICHRFVTRSDEAVCEALQLSMAVNEPQFLPYAEHIAASLSGTQMHWPEARLHVSGLGHVPGMQWHPVPTPLMVPQVGVGFAHTRQVVLHILGDGG